MSMGRRKTEQQPDLWIPTADVPQSAGPAFYDQLNGRLAGAGFDRHVEGLCQEHYADGAGRESIPPGVYVRLLLVGYFEGLDAQRGIARRCGDRRSLRAVLGGPFGEATPDHASPTKIRPRLPLDVPEPVFVSVPGVAYEQKRLRGKAVAVDSTTLEANAAMKSIVRRDTGEDYKAYRKRLLAEDGVENPTDEDVRRFYRKRPKKGSNAEWESPTDPDRRIATMKDRRTHLAYKAEHAVDLGSEFVLAAAVYTADQADAATLMDSLAQAQVNLMLAGSEQVMEEAVADKGYHKAEALADGEPWGTRTSIPEPKRERRVWADQPAGWERAVRANRRRIRGARGKRLQERRSESVGRSFAHVCETGGGRRTWLRGWADVTKRHLAQVAGHHLAVLMRKRFGVGKPRTLQGAGGLVGLVFWLYWWSASLLGRRYRHRAVAP